MQSFYIKVAEPSTHIDHYFVCGSRVTLLNNLETIKNFVKTYRNSPNSSLSHLGIKYLSSIWDEEPTAFTKIMEIEA